MLIITHSAKRFEQVHLLMVLGRHQIPCLVPQVWYEVLSAAHLLRARMLTQHGRIQTS